MARWFRFYDEALNDPKVQKLPAPLFKTWINVLCLASSRDGALPPVEDIAFALRLGAKEASKAVRALLDAGLLDRDGDGYTPHNWQGRQYSSDSAAERMRRHRQRKRDVTSDGGVTSPVTSRNANSDGADSDTDSDTEQNRTEERVEPASPAAPPAAGLDLPDFLDRLRATRLEIETLPDDWRAFCAAERPDLDAERTFALFRDHWIAKPGKDGRKLDWLATWRTWVRRERGAPGSLFAAKPQDPNIPERWLKEAAGEGH